jgi:hypothetical protein
MMTAVPSMPCSRMIAAIGHASVGGFSICYTLPFHKLVPWFLPRPIDIPIAGVGCLCGSPVNEMQQPSAAFLYLRADDMIGIHPTEIGIHPSSEALMGGQIERLRHSWSPSVVLMVM